MNARIADLPHEERAGRYRQLAEETRQLARRADTEEVRQAYESLAAQWRSLAEYAEERAAAVRERHEDTDDARLAHRRV